MKKIMFNDAYGLTQAVLEGRKTMTRRICSKGAAKEALEFDNWSWAKYHIGEIVAVAQCYKDVFYTGGLPHQLVAKPGWTNKMFVRADLMLHQIRILNVRVERLQDISDGDCEREGIGFVGGYSESYYFGHGVGNIKLGNSYREAFAALIDKVSGKGTWESNPWVFVYEFELVK